MGAGVLQIALLRAIPWWVWAGVVLVSVLLSLGVTLRFERPRGRWGHALRRRFVLGIPWGTLLTVAGVAAFYLVVQAGYEHPRKPLMIPFVSWSYFYPFGVLTSPFAHSGLNHVTSNLVGTLTFMPVAEYAWGHFPQSRGSQSFARLRDNPFVRILAVPAAAVGVGLLSGVFSFGPTIGFSGVVFAIAGFALASYPITSILVFLGARIVDLVIRATTDPFSVSRASEVFVTPGWANIAIQGHLYGFLLGLALGGYLAVRRDRLPGPGRLWFATLLFAVLQGLWQLYTPISGGRFVLYRAVGVAVIFLLAALIVGGMGGYGDRMFLSRLDLPLTDRSLTADLRTRELAGIVFGALLVALSLTAVWTGLFVLDDGVDGEISVDGYEVTYAEGITDQYTSTFAVGPFGGGKVNTSGVIVTSESREIFYTFAGKRELAARGSVTLALGSPGRYERVVANRTAWNPVGNDSVYKVYLSHDERRRLAFTSNPSTVQPRIAGRRIVLEPAEQRFGLAVVSRNETLGRTEVPTVGNNVTAGGLAFNRTKSGGLFAFTNDTRVRIAGRG
ncbi:rhomboid family intramembrane serine protease [Halorientalis regularis]|jgi:membrane associated rhomboid family serine protease|uniref:Membrane associated serine protease, rhomboid family n=1 Tax=Halorientalis regularis TaxID=660518 RepID=A0A1G7N5A5_9EURY|nr:rhomboid family intramembrane serine protease [Halorientalis regularis]SDF69077.1 Membrane associated serine protease, rhomboid family [Halorientalis regularis]